MTALAAMAAAIGLAVVSQRTGFGGTSASAELTDTCRLIAAAVFVGAGVLRISHWYVAGDRPSVFTGSALVTLGIGGVPLVDLAKAMSAPTAHSVHEQLARGVTVSVVLILVFLALRRQVEGSAPAVLVLAIALGAAAVGLVLMTVLQRSMPGMFVASPSAEVGLYLMIAAGWAGAAIIALGHRREQPWAARLVPLLGTLATAATFTAASVHGGPAWRLAAAVLFLTVAGLSAHCAVMDFVTTTMNRNDHVGDVEAALAEANHVVRSQDSWREELAHDAHNAVAGVRAALLTLKRYEESLDPATVERLRSAAIDELGHLEHLIERTEEDRSVDFELAEVLRAVAETRHATGLAVRLGNIHGRAHGRPGDVATVLQNLLVNAHTHAVGPVDVDCQEVDGTWEIRVIDHGPGIPEAQLDRLFSRGGRGPDSRGTGLGLYVSRQLMLEQAGDLTLTRHTGGCTFLITLPIAPPLHVPSQPTVAQVSGDDARRQHNASWLPTPALETR
jgi:signal transduction histidine kinase